MSLRKLMDREIDRPIEIPVRWLYYALMGVLLLGWYFDVYVPVGLYLGVFFGTALLIFWMVANPEFDLIKFT